MTRHFLWSFACTVLLLCSRSVLARKEEVSLLKDDRSLIVVSTPFGFTVTGNVHVFVTKLLMLKAEEMPDADLSKVGFFLAPSASETQIQMEMEDNCVLGNENPSNIVLFTLKDIKDESGTGDINYAAQFELANLIPSFEGGELSLYYAKCLEDEYVVTLDISLSMFNVKGNDEQKFTDYLSVGDDALPLLYMALFVLFSISAAMWGATLYVAKQASHRVHYLMLVLIIFKSLTLLSQAGMYKMISIYGRPDGWQWAFYLFTFLRGVLFFTLVVLIGTGWSYMKPFIASREKKILMVVIPLQVLANIAIIVIDENTPAKRTWFTWREVLHLVDIICCCAVLFPIVWSIKHLRDASQTDGKAARSLQKLQLFRQFYVIVVSYIYFTRIVVYLLRSTMPYNYSWVSEAAGELATLSFYVITGLQFRPKADNPYLALDVDDLDELELSTKADD